MPDDLDTLVEDVIYDDAVDTLIDTEIVIDGDPGTGGDDPYVDEPPVEDIDIGLYDGTGTADDFTGYVEIGITLEWTGWGFTDIGDEPTGIGDEPTGDDLMWILPVFTIGDETPLVDPPADDPGLAGDPIDDPAVCGAPVLYADIAIL